MYDMYELLSETGTENYPPTKGMLTVRSENNLKIFASKLVFVQVTEMVTIVNTAKISQNYLCPST
jgi:hypothetical protein